MNHLDEGTLQAFLDDELSRAERAEAAEHLLACPDCRTLKDELSRANAVFGEAMAVLDVPAPADSAPPRVASAFQAAEPEDRGRRAIVFRSAPFVKAASLILVVAAAASAAVPGSPVREWIVKVVAPTPVEVVEEAPAPEPAAEPVEVAPAAEPAPVPAGVSLVAEGPVEIRLQNLDGTTLRLVETDGPRVAVSSAGAEVDPIFRTGPGRIDVRDAIGGEIIVAIPRAVASARLIVDGELYAEKDAGELHVYVPAESDDHGARIWR